MKIKTLRQNNLKTNVKKQENHYSIVQKVNFVPILKHENVLKYSMNLMQIFVMIIESLASIE